MYYFKNISVGTITLGALGVVMSPNEERGFDSVGGTENIVKSAGFLSDLVYNNSLIVTDSDGIVYSKSDSVLIIADSHNIVSVVNVDEFNPTKNDIYYFMKDKFTIPKGTSITKHFRGSVSSLFLTPYTGDLEVTIISGNTLRMPVEKLIQRQTLEFNFDNRIEDMEVIITSTGGNSSVDLFVDGHAKRDSVDELQSFIDTWYEDDTIWNTSKCITVKDRIPNILWGFTKTNDSVNGNTVSINTTKVQAVNKEFEIYQQDKDIIVEYIEWDVSTAWNPNQFYTVFKNVRYITFTDQTIDLTITPPINWADRTVDGRHY